MSKTFMRGLELLETIDRHGPLTVTELAQLTATDKSTVSRTLAACEPDGWIVRSNGRVALGPRATLLAHSSSTATLMRQAEPLVEAITGMTGFVAQAYALVGRGAVVVATAGPAELDFPAGLKTVVPIYATAAGKAIAAQLDPAQLGPLLPPEPYPDPTREMLGLPAFATLVSELRARSGKGPRTADTVPRTRRDLDRQIAAVRGDGAAFDRGELHPEIACIAVPWPRPAMPAALACLAAPAQLAAGERLIRSVLRAASAPGASRADVAAAARPVRLVSAGE
jgi:DNA-binding IclR family transcriptional regulator